MLGLTVASAPGWERRGERLAGPQLSGNVQSGRPARDTPRDLLSKVGSTGHAPSWFGLAGGPREGLVWFFFFFLMSWLLPKA